MSVDRSGWNRGWDVRGATAGLFLVAAAVALLARDDAVLDALPGLAVAAVVACALLAVALAQLDVGLATLLRRPRPRRR